MKFTAFKTIPAICVDFSDEGKLYFGIADDQDPELLKRAFEAVESGLGELPEDLQLVWPEKLDGTVAIRHTDDERNETGVSGDFYGSGVIVEATYDKDGKTYQTGLMEGDDDSYMEDICAGLQALLEPVRIVADISGGALHGTYADRPAVVLYKSDDSDDVMDFKATEENATMLSMGDDEVAHWVHEAELFSDIVDHYHNQVNP